MKLINKVMPRENDEIEEEDDDFDLNVCNSCGGNQGPICSSCSSDFYGV